MALFRAGLVLFVSVTIVSLAIGFALLWTSGSISAVDISSYLEPMEIICGVVFLMCAAVTILARRGRHHPVTDGIFAANILVIGPLFVEFIISAISPRYADSMIMFTWVNAGLYLACIVPAHLISYGSLFRTPLLRGLVPQQKSKGPAEASP